MKLLPLSQGKHAIVDEADYEWLSQWKWCAASFNGKWYAARMRRKPESGIALMHREIMGAAAGEYTDHINGDGLDNRRENLRLCSHAQNMSNSRHRSNNKSGFRGVDRPNPKGRWRAKITVNRRSIHLGYYDAKEEAARAYDEAAIRYFGEFARPNFTEVA